MWDQLGVGLYVQFTYIRLGFQFSFGGERTVDNTGALNQHSQFESSNKSKNAVSMRYVGQRFWGTRYATL